MPSAPAQTTLQYETGRTAVPHTKLRITCDLFLFLLFTTPCLGVHNIGKHIREAPSCSLLECDCVLPFLSTTSKYELPSDGSSRQEAPTWRRYPKHRYDEPDANCNRPKWASCHQGEISYPTKPFLLGHETTKNELMILWTMRGVLIFPFTLLPFTIGTPLDNNVAIFFSLVLVRREVGSSFH